MLKRQRGVLASMERIRVCCFWDFFQRIGSLWTFSSLFLKNVQPVNDEYRKLFSNSNKTSPSSVVAVKSSRPRVTSMRTVYLVTRLTVQMDLPVQTLRKEKECVSVISCNKSKHANESTASCSSWQMSQLQQSRNAGMATRARWCTNTVQCLWTPYVKSVY